MMQGHLVQVGDLNQVMAIRLALVYGYPRGQVRENASLKGVIALDASSFSVISQKSFTGHSFWARGYFVSTVGRDEEAVRQYIRKKESQDRRLDQPRMFE